MRTGRVKFFNTKYKFGFITDTETGKDFYVHVKDIAGPVAEGDVVEFETEERKKGPVAVQVRKKTG